MTPHPGPPDPRTEGLLVEEAHEVVEGVHVSRRRRQVEGRVAVLVALTQHLPRSRSRNVRGVHAHTRTHTCTDTHTHTHTLDVK